MKAIVIEDHGGPEVLKLDPGFPDPEPGPEDVIVRVRSTSLNYHDIFTRRGMPGIKIPMPAIMGLDLAGEIAVLGDDVEGWSVGDRVLVDPVNRVEGGLMGETCHGGLAELCRVHQSQLISLPDAVSFDDAATLPVAFGSAHRMIVTHGQLKQGEKVLVLGASGGVGVASVMLGRLLGAEVTACTSSADKAAVLCDLGADHVIDYVAEDLAKAAWGIAGKPRRHSQETGYDMVVNFTGGDTWAQSLRCLKPQGRMVTNGATAGYDPKTDIRYIFGLELQIRGSTGFKPDDIARLLALTGRGDLKPQIDKRLPLEEAREAFRLLEEREVIGKVVINP